MHNSIVGRIGATCLLAASLLSPVPATAWCGDQPGLWYADDKLVITKHVTDVEFRLHDCAKEIAELREELAKANEAIERLSALGNPDVYAMILDLHDRVKALEDRDRSK